MQISKVKFVGSSVRFTTNQVYDVIAWDGANVTVLDDNNIPYGSADVSSADWDLEYLAVVEIKQLYP